MELKPLYLAGFAAGTTLGLLLLLAVVQRSLPADMKEGNTARKLLRVGQVLAVFMVSASAVQNCVLGEDLLHDVTWVAAFGVTALALVLVTGEAGVRLLLQSRLMAEVERGNTAAGLAAGAHFAATGIVTARAIGGNDVHSLLLSLAFFGIAQVTLHLFVTLFRALTTYDDAEQIVGENMAASISYAGVAVAVALVVGRAVEGEFYGWMVSLKGYGGVLLSAVLLYPVRQLFVQTVILRAPPTLRGGRIDAGIAVERNEGLAALEAACYVATALSIARLA